MVIKHNENGSAAVIIAIAIAVLVLGGGAVAYFVTDGFGTKTDDSSNTEKSSNGTNNDTAKDSASDDEGIPAGFPADMPIFKPSVVLTSDKDDDGYTLGLQAKDASEEEVMSFYETELTKAGWASRHNLAASSVMEVSKGGWAGSVTVHESTTTDIGTIISYIINKQ